MNRGQYGNPEGLFTKVAFEGFSSFSNLIEVFQEVIVKRRRLLTGLNE